MSSQTSNTNSENAETPQQNRYKLRNAAHASTETKREVLKQAKQVGTLAAAGHSPGSAKIKEQARLLLKAAIDWQNSAVEAAAEAGKEARARPHFQNGPKPPDLKAQPGAKKYQSRLFFWASRYAWDKRDGLDAKEAARNLVLTAYVGYHTKRPEAPQPSQAGSENAGT